MSLPTISRGARLSLVIQVVTASRDRPKDRPAGVGESLDKIGQKIGRTSEFVEWFLKVALDQVQFMSSLFELDTLAQRLRRHVERSDEIRPEAARLLEEALIRGEFERGEIARITGLPERTARRVLNDLTSAGLLASDTPKSAVTLRFPSDILDLLFPRL